jgi:hypothetical protein
MIATPPPTMNGHPLTILAQDSRRPMARVLGLISDLLTQDIQKCVRTHIKCMRAKENPPLKGHHDSMHAKQLFRQSDMSLMGRKSVQINIPRRAPFGKGLNEGQEMRAWRNSSKSFDGVV